MGKTAFTKPPPSRYRDEPEPDRDDAASTSSAVPLEGVNVHDNHYHDDAELPAYEDVPRLPSTQNGAVRPGGEQPS